MRQIAGLDSLRMLMDESGILTLRLVATDFEFLRCRSLPETRAV